MSVILQHLKRFILLYLGLVIYFLFVLSVAKTGWFDFLYSGAALHIGAKGIDFFQIPRGAWAFWHGGTLSGDLPRGGIPYAPDETSNGNVYHPLFSLTFGTLLTLFDAAHGPYVWLWFKFVISLLTIVYFFWNFRTSQYCGFAIFVMCVNFSVYLELAAWQFQFVLNIFLILLLISLTKKRSFLWSGLLYWLGLIIKPIGLLLIPVLFVKGHWKVVALGLWLFFLSTIVFVIRGSGSYYVNYLSTNLSGTGNAGPNQIITFSALLHYMTHWPELVYQAIHDGVLLLAIFPGFLKRTHIAKATFLLIAYYVSFYEGAYEYQWSTLAYVLAVCIVACPEFRTRRAIVCILLVCLPSCFALLNFWHIDIQDYGSLGFIPGAIAWEWMVASKLLPLFLLTVVVTMDDILPAFRELKAFWKEMRVVNQRLNVFGEASSEKSLLAEMPPAAPVEDSPVGGLAEASTAASGGPGQR